MPGLIVPFTAITLLYCGWPSSSGGCCTGKSSEARLDAGPPRRSCRHILVALTAYVRFGGADFGGGGVDLLPPARAGRNSAISSRMPSVPLGSESRLAHPRDCIAVTCFPKAFATNRNQPAQFLSR